MKKKISFCGMCKSAGNIARCILCGNKNVIVYHCDKCGRVIQGDVFGVHNKDLCLECLKAKFRKDV